jgi:hypothetical protein
MQLAVIRGVQLHNSCGINVGGLTVAGGDGDHDGGRELCAEAAGVGDLGDLHAQAAGDVAGEQRQAKHDADATDDQDPLWDGRLQGGRSAQLDDRRVMSNKDLLISDDPTLPRCQPGGFLSSTADSQPSTRQGKQHAGAGRQLSVLPDGTACDH